MVTPIREAGMNNTMFITDADDDLVERSACMALFDPDCPEVQDGRIPVSNTPTDVIVAELEKQGIQPLILDASWKWPLGTQITIKFLDRPSTKVENRIKSFASSWLPYARGLSFNWITSGNADIRISLRPGGSWSYVGTGCRRIEDQTQPTMNYGWFNDGTPDSEFSRTVTHEFGHALGCVHEQFSPKLKITWNKDVVYAAFKDSDKWDKATVDNAFNNFVPLSGDNFLATSFDAGSIMCYPIKKEWNQEGISVVQSSVLSDLDKAFISQLYPQTT